MSWIFRNNWLWYVLSSSGLIDQTLLVYAGPCLQVLGWSVTSSYQLFKWWTKKPPKERIVVLECRSIEIDPYNEGLPQRIEENKLASDTREQEDFVVVSVSDRILPL
jgi:hypothetical protein